MQSSYKLFKYAELVGKDGMAPSIQTWSDTDSQATLVYDVPWDDYTDDLPGKILGYSYLATDGSHQLRRVIPLQHPLYPQLWATKIEQAQPFNFDDMEDDGPTGDQYAAYECVRLHVIFTSLPYDVLSDADLLTEASIYSDVDPQPDESLRYVTKRSSVSIQTLDIPNGSLKYAEGPLVGKPVSGAPQHQRLMHRRLDWTWMKVADSYLMTKDTDVPTNLDLCVGSVNENDWNGYAAGTLLMMPYELEPVEAPTLPANVGLPNYGPARMWNVKLHFDYFDPKPVSTNHGWNLLPPPQLSVAEWTFATGGNVSGHMAGTLTGIPIYTPVDFDTMFQSPN